MGVKRFVWDEVSDNVLLETDETDTVTARYAHRPEQFGELLIQERSSKKSFYHYDGNSSTCNLTDSSESVTDTTLYTAYGEEVSSSGSTTNPFGYKGSVGYYTNESTGDIYVRNRSYEPAAGRWMSMDPLGFVDGTSLYRAYFVPNIVDPRGLAVCEVRVENCKRACEKKYPKPDSNKPPVLYHHGQQLNGCFRDCNFEYDRCIKSSVDDLIDLIDADDLACFNPCGKCTPEKLRELLEDIKEAIPNTVCRPYWGSGEWSPNNCGRWADGFLDNWSADKHKDCVYQTTSTVIVEYQHGYASRHQVVRFVLCDGSIFYVDNGWSGGPDQLCRPSDVQAGPITWRHDRCNHEDFMPK